MILLLDVLVLQNNIRNLKKVSRMTQFVKEGGRFSADELPNFSTESSLITIAEFKTGLEKMPNGIFPHNTNLLLLHDGHHRFLSMFLGGRTCIYDEEYKIAEFENTDSYNSINAEVGWYTPLEVYKEIRYADIAPFKNHVKTLPQEEIEDYIKQHKTQYCAKRRGLYTVQDLANSIADDLIFE